VVAVAAPRGHPDPKSKPPHGGGRGGRDAEEERRRAESKRKAEAEERRIREEERKAEEQRQRIQEEERKAKEEKQQQEKETEEMIVEDQKAHLVNFMDRMMTQFQGQEELPGSSGQHPIVVGADTEGEETLSPLDLARMDPDNTLGVERVRERMRRLDEAIAMMPGGAPRAAQKEKEPGELQQNATGEEEEEQQPMLAARVRKPPERAPFSAVLRSSAKRRSMQRSVVSDDHSDDEVGEQHDQDAEGQGEDVAEDGTVFPKSEAVGKKRGGRFFRL
jgi:hypothetical protein